MTLLKQVRNPMGFYCPPNGATPDYITYHDFESWLAYGMLICWFGPGDDPNKYCSFPRPYTEEDVRELRGYLLDAVETIVVSVWKDLYKRGDGFIDGDWESLIIGERDENDDAIESSDDVFLRWTATLQDDALMFEQEDGGDGTAIWLAYEAIEDKAKVLDAIIKARATLATGDHPFAKVWPDLVEIAVKEIM